MRREKASSSAKKDTVEEEGAAVKEAKHPGRDADRDKAVGDDERARRQQENKVRRERERKERKERIKNKVSLPTRAVK